MNRTFTQLSLVAFYGKKDNNILWKYLYNIQEKIKKSVPDYEPYDEQQIHGTIVGLEGAKLEDKIISKNYFELKKIQEELKLESILKLISSQEFLPITIRIGGFANDGKDSFTSRGDNPYSRSFSIQKDIIVAMGWPHIDGKYSPILDTLRRRTGRLGALHKYHNYVSSYDNDFFFVLGNLNSSVNEKVKTKLHSEIRNEMKKWGNINIDIHKNDIKVIQYTDTKFKNATSYKLEDSMKKIEFLCNAYPEFNYANNWLNTPL